MNKGVRCDALTSKGARCRCYIARKHAQHRCFKFGMARGVYLCANHWGAYLRGRTIRVYFHSGLNIRKDQ